MDIPPPESRPETEAATFNARLPMHMKKVLQRAADIRHQTLTEFVLGSAYDRAMTTILDDTVLRLCERAGFHVPISRRAAFSFLQPPNRFERRSYAADMSSSTRLPRQRPRRIPAIRCFRSQRWRDCG
jgi:uncharacterized protein (DUF1778 family)